MAVLSNWQNLRLRIASDEKSVSEEDVRQAFNEDIKCYLEERYNKKIIFRNEVKTSVSTFIDSKWENFVIEYKKPAVSLGDKERNQLLGYLNELGEYGWGILTNGKIMEIYTYSYLKQAFVKDEVFSGDINDEQFKYICNVIANKEKLILTENNINEYLGIETNKELIRIIFSKLNKSLQGRTLLLYNEWQKLFNLSDQHDVLDVEKKGNVIKFYQELFDVKIDSVEKEHKALFAIQTYYSIILKLALHIIILNKTNQARNKPKFLIDFFAEIESNEIYRRYNIQNLIDGDFFSWYLQEFNQEELDLFYEKFSEVATIETGRINLLFAKLYENIFPFWVRHSMGEYYTPFSLAENIVNNSISMVKSQGKKSLLDPTCGSGIFLMCALSKGIDKIYGIDINPLAVLTAKINYLINKFDISKPFEIPIYLGDSTYFPSLQIINGVEAYVYEMTTSVENFETIKFVFSKDVVNEMLFFQILDEIESQIKHKNFAGAINVIKSYHSFYYSQLRQYYDDLVATLIELEKKDLNSIWLKIIGNYLKSGAIRNVDCVVGNPPWVRWANLPDQYKTLIKKNCRIDGVFSSDRNSGGVDLNICALITFITIRERLHENGALGFIMPDSLLFNKSFEGFRNMQLPERRFYLNRVVRWNNKNERPFDPVAIDFAEFYFTFHEEFPIKVFDRKNMTHMVAFQNNNSFNNHYIVATHKEYEKINKVLGSNKLVFRSGINLLKGGYYLLKFKEKISDRISEFYRYERVGRSIRLSTKTIRLETEIVFPFIKSDSIEDNTITKSDLYCIFPYPYGSKIPYDLHTLRIKYPLFYAYYMSPEVQEAINTQSKYNKRIQKTNLDIGIFRVGEYTYSDYFLITRDNTKSVFALIGKLKTDWGEEKMPIFDGHINYLSRGENGKPLSREMCEELFNIFISDGVKSYIKASSDARSISSRLYNDIRIV